MSNNVVRYGFKTIHDRMDAHVERENARSQPRRMKRKTRDKNGRFTSNVVHYPYGGKPYESYVKPGGFRARQDWKRTVQDRRDQVGKQVARDASEARPGCALITVHASEATALAFKLRAALKGGQVRDTFGAEAGSELYRARSERVLETLTHAAETGQTVRIGVYTRNELVTIARQLTPKKHQTSAVRNLERKLKGK